MKKKTIITLAIIIVGLIGGKWYMEREKDKKELLDIQTDLANYLYDNYRLYTFDEQEKQDLEKKYNNGDLEYREYSNELDRIAKYSDINKIEFTGFSVGPMKTLKVSYIINDTIKNETSLDTISAETDKLIYRVGSHFGDGPDYLEKKKTPSDLPIPEKMIVYYHGGIK